MLAQTKSVGKKGTKSFPLQFEFIFKTAKYAIFKKDGTLSKYNNRQLRIWAK